MDKKQLEAELEQRINQANQMLKGGLLEWIYGNNPMLQKRRDFYESQRVKAEEQLYNLRNGDSPCLPSTGE